MSRLEIVYIPTNDLIPYENNPRDNADAVASVAQSMLDFGFRVPLTVGPDRIIDTGHTRVLAAKYIIDNYPDRAEEFSELPVIFNDDLTEDQRRAFRLVDNKTAELATWDFDLLAGEVSALQDAGVPLADYGWTQEEIDCLNNVVAMDCLTQVELDPDADPDVENEPDGVNSNVRRQASVTSPDNQAVRVSFGELAFFVLKDDFDQWYDSLRRDCNYDSEVLIDEVARRLGLLNARNRRLRLLANGETEEDGREVFEEPTQSPDA